MFNVSPSRIPLLSRIVRLSRAEIWMLVALMLIAGLVWAFVGLAEEVLEGDTQGFDEAVLRLLREPNDLSEPIGPSWVEESVRDLTALGSYSVLGLLVFAVVAYLAIIRKRVIALLLLASVLGGSLVSVVLKELFSRPRPSIEHAAEVFTASFPSGHALTSAVTYLTLGVILARTEKSPRVRAYIVGIAVLITLIVGLSRLYLGVHYPTDVLAGWCLGAVWAGLCLIGAAYLQRRGAAEQPGRPEQETGAPDAAA